MNEPSSGAPTPGAPSNTKSVSGKGPILTGNLVTSERHTTFYWEAGPNDGPLMIFLHGWPEIGLIWRAQIEAFAAEGWHCVAPDMRGYGRSSSLSLAENFTMREIFADMIELYDELEGGPAVWVGHDWGSPVAASIAAQHPDISRGTVLISVPYFPDAFALPSFLPVIDRGLYPLDTYPDGQWDYFRFYLTHFGQTVSDFDADVPATLASIYCPGNPASVGKISPTALVTANGGRYGSAGHAPPTQPDLSLWPLADFDALVDSFVKTGFRACNAWYLNDDESIAYAHAAPDNGRLRQPVLFINGEYDLISNINQSRVGEPMKKACEKLSIVSLNAGHWLPLECKIQTTDAIRSWLKTVK